MPSVLDFRWDDLRLFLVAHRSRSLTKAAERLSLNQSTLSRRLSAFEEALGARLFDRTPEGLVPTELAERLLGPAERAEAASHDVARMVAGERQELEGEVRLALSEGVSFFLLAPAMGAFRDRYPGIALSMVVSDAVADLTRREADVALRFFRPTSGDLVAKRIFAGPYGVFGSPAFAEALGPGPHPVDAVDFIGWDDLGSSSFPELKWERDNGVRVSMRASSITTRIALAQAGCGAVQLARVWGRSLSGLVEIETPPFAMEAEVWLVTHRALRDVPRVQAVWDFVESTFAELVDGASS